MSPCQCAQEEHQIESKARKDNLSLQQGWGGRLHDQVSWTRGTRLQGPGRRAAKDKATYCAAACSNAARHDAARWDAPAALPPAAMTPHDMMLPAALAIATPTAATSFAMLLPARTLSVAASYAVPPPAAMLCWRRPPRHALTQLMQPSRRGLSAGATG